MEKIYEWGIAMAGCEEAIKEALIKANESVSVKDAPEFYYIEIGIAEGLTFARVLDFLFAQDWEFFADAIDIENGWSLNVDQFKLNTEAYSDNVSLCLDGSPLALTTYEANSICAILIDGDHSKKAVIYDFNEADRIIAKGGVIMFHDSAPEDQRLDDTENQKGGIEVRAALEELGLLDGTNTKYKILTDISGDKEKNGRGIFIIQRTIE